LLLFVQNKFIWAQQNLGEQKIGALLSNAPSGYWLRGWIY